MDREAFRRLYSDSRLDVPLGYRMGSGVPSALQDEIPGQRPFTIEVKTSSDEMHSSSVQDVVLGVIKAKGRRSPKIRSAFDRHTMWHSA